MKIDIHISGSGTSANIAKELIQIAQELKAGNHIEAVTEKGSAIWEDKILITSISETV